MGRESPEGLVALGFIDDVSAPAGSWSVFNQIRGPKDAVPMPDSPHDHLATAWQQPPYTRRSGGWLDVLVRGGDPTAPRGAQ